MVSVAAPDGLRMSIICMYFLKALRDNRTRFLLDTLHDLCVHVMNWVLKLAVSPVKGGEAQPSFVAAFPCINYSVKPT